MVDIKKFIQTNKILTKLEGVKIYPKNMINICKNFSQEFTGGPVVKNAIFSIN